MSISHHYRATIRWTGNLGSGTSEYRAYSREHLIEVAGKPLLLGSSDPQFRGDPSRHNPEDLLLASLSACHMLWFLHLSADSGLVVERYSDDAEGVLETIPDGSGHFTSVTLHPKVTISRGTAVQAAELHERAHHRCFIAQSVNFPVRHEPTTEIESPLAPS
jgi:organic hydroperoxide reductase OsmC/OhrA